MAGNALKKAKTVGTVQFNFKRMINGLYEVDVIFRDAKEPVFEITTILFNKEQIAELVSECDVSSCIHLHYPIFLANSVKLSIDEKLIYFGEHYPVPFNRLVGGAEIATLVDAFDFPSNKSDIYADFPPSEDDEPEQGEIPLS